MNAYDESQKVYWDNYAIEKTAEMFAEEAKQAKEQAEQAKKQAEQAEQKGMQKGVQKGIQEEKFVIARAMKQDGHPVATIARYTGLSEAQINQL